jgi:hypothetical protein
MDAKKSLFVLICTCLLICGCSTTKTSKQTQKPKPIKTKQIKQAHFSPVLPESITLLNTEPPTTKYKVIGQVAVNRYNKVGVKRQKAIINDLIRNKAASLGGDAVVNIHKNSNLTTGEVVQLIA